MTLRISGQAFSDDLFNELKKNGINILQDESILVDNSFYIIGRKDYSVQKEHQKDCTA